MSTNRHLAQFIKPLRKAKGFTQQSLAVAMGLSIGTVNNWECNDGAQPRDEQLVVLAKLLGVSPIHLWTLKCQDLIEETEQCEGSKG